MNDIITELNGLFCKFLMKNSKFKKTIKYMLYCSFFNFSPFFSRQYGRKCERRRGKCFGSSWFVVVRPVCGMEHEQCGNGWMMDTLVVVGIGGCAKPVISLAVFFHAFRLALSLPLFPNFNIIFTLDIEALFPGHFFVHASSSLAVLLRLLSIHPFICIPSSCVPLPPQQHPRCCCGFLLIDVEERNGICQTNQITGGNEPPSNFFLSGFFADSRLGSQPYHHDGTHKHNTNQPSNISLQH